MQVSRAVVIFTKPARPGRVKTRLVGELTAEEAAQLHRAFLEDVRSSLTNGPWTLALAWALEAGEEAPEGWGEGFPQEGADLGERLFGGLARLAATHESVAAVGSDHPELGAGRVEEAFRALEAGADLVLGPARDGGYYLVAARRERLERRVFEGIDWSTAEVLRQTREKAASLGLDTVLLERGDDVDTADDLRALCRRLEGRPGGCPATRGLLASWGRIGGGRG